MLSKAKLAITEAGDLHVNMDTANKVKSAIDNMKLGKAPGADGVSAEM